MPQRQKSAPPPNNGDGTHQPTRVYQIAMYLMHPPFHFVRYGNSSSRHVLRVFDLRYYANLFTGIFYNIFNHSPLIYKKFVNNKY